jgi:hypothetical protein
MSARVIAIILLLSVGGCGEAVNIPPQQWQDMTIHVESRPSPPRPGMNEFLVIATDSHGRPGYDLFILLRARDQDRWTEAIEDGEEGVYRRAVEVASGSHPELQVKIRRNKAETILYFPLRAKP